MKQVKQIMASKSIASEMWNNGIETADKIEWYWVV